MTTLDWIELIRNGVKQFTEERFHKSYEREEHRDALLKVIDELKGELEDK